MRISKRRRMARMLARSGVLRGVEIAFRRRGVVIWNYHRIGSAEGNPFDDGVFSATAEELGKHLRYLKKNFRLITMGEFLRSVETGYRDWSGAAAMVTFDDGYRDNFELALPVLRDVGVCATFFLPTEFLQSAKLPWWDRIAYVIKKTKEPRISLDYPLRVEINLDAGIQPPPQLPTGRDFAPLSLQSPGVPGEGENAGVREKAIQRIIAIYKSAVAMEDGRFFASLESAAKIDVDEVGLARGLFMDWEQARKLVAAGMSIGAHTHTHPILARLAESQQRWELAESKRILEERLNLSIAAFAYPVGSVNAFSETTKGVVRECGYRAAFSFYGGVNFPGTIDAMDVRRCAVDATDEFEELRARAIFLSAFGKSVV
jgi:peptidoglycan/xylan/chitin deacetylase (PgdA/CDA1 family)